MLVSGSNQFFCSCMQKRLKLRVWTVETAYSRHLKVARNTTFQMIWYVVQIKTRALATLFGRKSKAAPQWSSHIWESFAVVHFTRWNGSRNCDMNSWACWILLPHQLIPLAAFFQNASGGEQLSVTIQQICIIYVYNIQKIYNTKQHNTTQQKSAKKNNKPIQTCANPFRLFESCFSLMPFLSVALRKCWSLEASTDEERWCAACTKCLTPLTTPA